jgi:hypothetical protein
MFAGFFLERVYHFLGKIGRPAGDARLERARLTDSDQTGTANGDQADAAAANFQSHFVHPVTSLCRHNTKGDLRLDDRQVKNR